MELRDFITIMAGLIAVICITVMIITSYDEDRARKADREAWLRQDHSGLLSQQLRASAEHFEEPARRVARHYSLEIEKLEAKIKELEASTRLSNKGEDKP